MGSDDRPVDEALVNFDPPLRQAVLLRRYKRFLADIRFASGEPVTVHCPNTGAMMGLPTQEVRCWVSLSANAKRRYPHTLEMIETGGVPVGINTGLPNRLAEEAIASGRIPELSGYDRIRREVRYGTNSRIDLLLERDGSPPCHVEIKNVHLCRRAGLAEFPDCVTSRGAKHLDELALLARAGQPAAMLFVVQRSDVAAFTLARELDPAYAAAFDRARTAGVTMLAYRCRVAPESVAIEDRLAVL